MSTLSEKFKKADKALKKAMIICFAVGFFYIGTVLFIYLNNLFQWDGNKPVPIEVFRTLLRALRISTYMVWPTMGATFLLVGFRIWDYRRKRDAIKQGEKNDA
jgi:Na+-driven multidrug efflux pump